MAAPGKPRMNVMCRRKTRTTTAENAVYRVEAKEVVQESRSGLPCACVIYVWPSTPPSPSGWTPVFIPSVSLLLHLRPMQTPGMKGARIAHRSVAQSPGPWWTAMSSVLVATGINGLHRNRAVEGRSLGDDRTTRPLGETEAMGLRSRLWETSNNKHVKRPGECKGSPSRIAGEANHKTNRSRRGSTEVF